MDAGPYGIFVAVEGIDGSGKSTLIHSLARILRRKGIRTATLSEPTRSRYGKLARIAATTGNCLGAAILFTLDRMASRERLEKLLLTHELVISDRSYYSTIAYQGTLLSPQMGKRLLVFERQVARVPDLVLWLDGSLDLAIRRLKVRRQKMDALEGRKALRRVREGYRALAHEEPKRFRRLDFSHPRAMLVDEALALLSEFPALAGKAGR